MEEEDKQFVFYSASIEELNETIGQVEKDYATTLNTILQNKEKELVLTQFVSVKEDEAYMEVHTAADADGKPLYKNEKLREIQVRTMLKDIDQYQEVQQLQMVTPAMVTKLELVKNQLKILLQEKDYRIKVIK